MTLILTRNHVDLVTEVEKHIAADALVQGVYWRKHGNAVGGRGCFISCLTHSSSPDAAFERFGLPPMLLRICEYVFEALPPDEAKAFFRDFPGAVARDGKDLTRVPWKFLAAELRALPPQSDEMQAVINPVIAGMDLLASGGVWDTAAAANAAANAAAAAADADADARWAAADAADAARWAAASAADAARRADESRWSAIAARWAANAARWAVDAARWAVNADDDARRVARIRQRDTILRLIAEAS